MKIKIINARNIREVLEEYEDEIEPQKEDQIQLANGRKCKVTDVSPLVEGVLIVRAIVLASPEDFTDSPRGGAFRTRLV